MANTVEIEPGIFIRKEKDTLYLKLPMESRERILGKINEKERIFETYRKKSHVFLQNEGVGFCYMLLAKATLFDAILLKMGNNSYKIPLEFILLNSGSFAYFKKQGFEKQIFVKLEHLQQFKIN
jgi:hypothetical protein